MFCNCFIVKLIVAIDSNRCQIYFHMFVFKRLVVIKVNDIDKASKYIDFVNRKVNIKEILIKN